MTEYITHTKSIIVRPKDQPIFSEMATTISLDDEACGLFVVVEQSGHIDRIGKIAIYKVEWPHIRAAIDEMFSLVDGMPEYEP
jgi:hypothetical protein